MIPLSSASLFSSSSTALSLKPRLSPSSTFLPSLGNLKPLNPRYRASSHQKRIRNGCRAELSGDAPFVFAIGACVLNSLVFPVTNGTSDDESDSVMDSTDAKLAVMGIISFIPYFNWLSWVFAWLDTGKRRYAVYSLAYLAPYLRTNLSLSPEDSWLPIASILFCIAHIQLEASIRNGDFQRERFGETAKQTSLQTRKKDHPSGHEGIAEEDIKRKHKNLPSDEEQSRNEVGRWRVPQERLHDDEEEHFNGDSNEDQTW